MEIQQMQIAMVLSRKIVLILAAFKVMQKKKKKGHRGTENQKRKQHNLDVFIFLKN